MALFAGITENCKEFSFDSCPYFLLYEIIEYALGELNYVWKRLKAADAQGKKTGLTVPGVKAALRLMISLYVNCKKEYGVV